MQPVTARSALDGAHEAHGRRQVEAFLAKCGLQHYSPTFIDEGFDQLEALYEVTELDLEQMGVKRGHRRLLQRAIRNARSVPLASSPAINTIVPDLVGGVVHESSNNDDDDDDDDDTSTSTSTTAVSRTRRPSSTHPPPIIMSHHASICSMSGAQSSSMSSAEDDIITSDNIARCWKRKYERHPTPDKNAPVKPLSAYVMYCNDLRAEFKDKHLTFSDFAKYAGKRWKALGVPERQKYELQAQQAKDNYKTALERYKTTDEYKQYEQYLRDFREKHEEAGNVTAARSVGKPNKRSKRKRIWDPIPTQQPSSPPPPPVPPPSSRTGYPYWLLNDPYPNKTVSPDSSNSSSSNTDMPASSSLSHPK